MANKLKVAFCGGEGLNWALDHDLEHVRRITSGFVEEVPLCDAELVHSVWWRGIMHVPAEDLKNKVVIASIADDPKTMMSDPEYLIVRNYVTAWLSEYSESQDFVIKTRQNCFRFPDPIELDVFSSPDIKQNAREWLYQEFGVPQEPYLIGNFHRDSSMTDLTVPKKQKGADLFLEIATALTEQGANVHFLLAGPRRHYLRNHFNQRDIPYTFIGEELDSDDVDVNTRSLAEVAQMMPALDLYLITSRWEGAPNTLLEAVSSETCILSTPVGQAEDILYPEQIFRGVSEGVDLILQDMDSSHLNGLKKAGLSVLQKWNTDEALARRLRHIYHMALATTPKERKRFSIRKVKGSPGDVLRKTGKNHRHMSYSLHTDQTQQLEVGGFWPALFRLMESSGLDVSWNMSDADCLIVDGVSEVVKQLKPSRSRVVQHWVGGLSDEGVESQAQSLEWNRKFADLTVFASGWAAQEVLSQNYHYKNPMLIRRGVDTDIYTPGEERGVSQDGLRLISYLPEKQQEQATKELMELKHSFPELIGDWTVLTGQKPTGKEWAQQLRQHDLYVEFDSGVSIGVPVAQALGCGLPVLFKKGGLVPELSEFASLSFAGSEAFRKQLARMNEHYKHYRRLIWLPDMNDIVNQIKLASDACLALR